MPDPLFTLGEACLALQDSAAINASNQWQSMCLTPLIFAKKHFIAQFFNMTPNVQIEGRHAFAPSLSNAGLGVTDYLSAIGFALHDNYRYRQTDRFLVVQGLGSRSPCHYVFGVLLARGC